MELMLNEAQVAYVESVIQAGIIELDVAQGWLDGLTEVPLDLGEGMCLAGIVNEFELTRAVSTHTGISVASDIELEMYAAPHPQIPRELCVELLCVPMSEGTPDPFPVALTNPFDAEGVSFLKELLGVSEIKLHLAAPSHIRHEITACYGTEEEWAAYLAEREQGDGQEGEMGEMGEVSLNADQSQLNSEVQADASEPSETLVDARGRPQTIPDWSSYNTRHEERATALRELLSRG